MKVLRSGESFIIRETPGVLWFLGAFFILVGAFFVYGALGGYSNWHEAPLFVIAAHFSLGSIAVAAGAWIIASAPKTSITIDRLNGVLHLKTRGLWGGSETTYSFNEIDSFSVIEELDSEGDPVWSLGLKLKNGDVVKISRLESHVESYKRNFVFKANEFMRKQIPSYIEAEDESQSGKR